MQELIRRALDLDPAVLVDAGRGLPFWGGWLAIAFGLALAGFGAHRLALRGTAATLAALVGWYAADAVVGDPASIGVPADLLSWSGAVALGLLGAVWPVAAGFVICGLAGGLFFARWVPFDEPFLRLVPGGIASGVLGGLLTRAMAALASAFVGGALVAVGSCAVLLHAGWADWLAPHPVVTLLPLSLVFVSGSAFQLTRPAPGRQEKRKEREGEPRLSGGSVA